MNAKMKFACAVVVCATAAFGALADDIRISVFAGTVYNVARQRKTTLAEAARLLKDAGVTGFDTGYDNPQLAELAQTCLKPCNIYGFPRMLDAEHCAADLARFVETAAKYGAPRIMCVPSNFTDGVPNEAEYARLRDGLKSLVAQAKAKGITVTVEDFGGNRNPCSHATYLKRFMTDVPDLRFALDTGNLYYAGRGEDVREMQKWAADRVAHVHLKDQTAEDNHKYASLGLGAVPNRELVQTAQKNGYKGWYTLENLVGPDVLEDVVRQVAVLRHWCR